MRLKDSGSCNAAEDQVVAIRRQLVRVAFPYLSAMAKADPILQCQPALPVPEQFLPCWYIRQCCGAQRYTKRNGLDLLQNRNWQ